MKRNISERQINTQACVERLVGGNLHREVEATLKEQNMEPDGRARHLSAIEVLAEGSTLEEVSSTAILTPSESRPQDNDGEYKLKYCPVSPDSQLGQLVASLRRDFPQLVECGLSIRLDLRGDLIQRVQMDLLNLNQLDIESPHVMNAITEYVRSNIEPTQVPDLENMLIRLSPIFDTCVINLLPAELV